MAGSHVRSTSSSARWSTLSAPSAASALAPPWSSRTSASQAQATASQRPS
eukprot:CAMPEP_0115877694 /NCGR_PEP_ID=MMETSP0287-20121206/26361_1 /TAXON_ID=412157 /ORGANISM="Chrysochromulina rotalis, Strain UIO044" /LENGTH=49 /DNA_ID= /DNA_START= /DNA_END= /DNA_ORIENTATION=